MSPRVLSEKCEASVSFVHVVDHARFKVANLPGDKLPHVHNVLHCGSVGAPELQHSLDKGGHRQRLGVTEDEVCEVRQGNHVHTKVVEASCRLRGLQHQRETRLGDQGALVVAKMVHHAAELVPYVLQHHLLLLDLSHHRHHLAENADKHVHAGEGREEQVQEDEDVVNPVRLEHPLDELGLLGKDALQQQAVHRLGHRVEAAGPGLGAAEELREQDGKDVNDDHQQAEGGGDRPHRHQHALDQDHKLRHGAHEPRHASHPREPEDPQDPQDGGAPNVASVHTAQNQVEHHRNPRLPDHERDQGKVKEEPCVVERVKLIPEREEPGKDLKRKKQAEEVVDNLKYHGCIA
mmetsp:Transcript_89194/g.252760  ORF Transcript_89194/g.252760 Transcript_89194/m.252760 type:complete len:349 (+) Transcript_89194:30-1076(+)